MWVIFIDMHSGGGLKEPPFENIYLEIPDDIYKVTEPAQIFERIFGHDPDDVCYPTCGSNYSISEDETLEQATGYYRGCKFYYVNEKGDRLTWDKWRVISDRDREAYKGQYVEEPRACYSTLDEYRQRKDILIMTWPEILARVAMTEGDS